LIYDVAIVGAGPAGAQAAFTLEKKGFNIIIIDKQEFPRTKPCAGVLPPRIFSEVEVPNNIIERPLEGYKLVSPSGYIVRSSFPNPGIIVRREIFDSYLLSRLECTPTMARVDRIETQNDHIKIDCAGETLLARTLIGADGANSQIRRSIQEFQGQNEISLENAIALQYEVSIPNKKVDEVFGNWFEVHYTLRYGYGWISPLKGAVKVGVGGVGADFKNNVKSVLDDFLEHVNLLEIGKIIKTEAHLIPMKGPLKILSSNRVLLCGDAGGFVFPGTGEGIYYAIKSGRIAAEVLSWGLENQCLDAEPLGERYNIELEKKGLLSLRQVDFIEGVLSDSEKAESYVRKLGKLVI
jgi:geranylgeranyl reductase family protein